MLLLVTDSAAAPSPLQALAVQHLLQLASTDSAAFRETTAALDPDQRAKLEAAIRASVGTPATLAAAPARPAIQLRSSFG